MKNNFAILVSSCDAYSDLWRPFFSQFDRFWPMCPFTVYLSSNTKKYSTDSVKMLLSGVKSDWSTDLIHVLGDLKEEYIFLWMEDLFLTKPVDTSRFLRGFRFMQQVQANHMHMSAFIKPDGYTSDMNFGLYGKGAPYRVNAPGFWKKSHLLELLIAGENPWKFEIMGSYRSSYYDGYYCMMQELFEFIRVVEKGSIRKGAYDYCIQNGISLDTRQRHVDSVYEKFKSNAKEQIFDLLMKIPWRLRLNTMEIMRRILASY